MELNYRPGDSDRSYPYAKNSLGRVTHITEVDDKELYVCIGCGTEMIPRRGEGKTWHFAHKTLSTCSGESWLHITGKMLFIEEYQKRLTEKNPFYIGFDYPYKALCEKIHSCEKSKEHRHYEDLTKYYTHIETEKKHGNFIPDIRLYNPDTGYNMYIEIAVTHRLSEEKKRSGYKIIEIQLKDKKCLEKMTKSFSDCLIDCTWVRFVNIKKPVIEIPEYTQRPCEGKLCLTFKYEHELKINRILLNSQRQQELVDRKYDEIAAAYRSTFQSDINKEKQDIKNRAQESIDELNQSIESSSSAGSTTDKAKIIDMMADFGYDFEGVVAM